MYRLSVKLENRIMPRTPKGPPAYRHHKARNCAVCTISGKNFYLGRYNSPESYEAYARLIAEWKANHCTLPGTPQAIGQGMLVCEVVNAYRKWAEGYYVKNGKPTSQQHIIRRSVKPLNATYGTVPAAELSPLSIRALQGQLLEAGLLRTDINKQLATIRHMLKWAASHAMIPVAVYQAAVTVPGLKRGRTTAPESEPILPVDNATVDATLEHLPQVVADMVRLQRLIGCRPGEVCMIRPCDIDTAGEVWCYIPESHKTEHHGRERRIYIGPRGQDVLRPYLLREKTAYCFRPIDSEKKRREEQRERRKTKVQPSQVCRKKKQPAKQPTECYDKDSYGRAVRRGAILADRAAKRQAKVDGIQIVEGQRLVKHWHPNQLRHSGRYGDPRQVRH